MHRPSRLALYSLVVVLGGAAVAPLHAQAPAQPQAQGRGERVAALLPEIDRMYAELADKAHLPGLVYGVVLDGKLVHVRSLGLADVGRKIDEQELRGDGGAEAA